MQVKHRLSCSIKWIERLNPWIGCTEYGWRSGSLTARCRGQSRNWHWTRNIWWFFGRTKIHRLGSGCRHLANQSFTLLLHNCILPEELLLLSPAYYSSVAWKVGFSARDEEKNESHLRSTSVEAGCSESGSQSIGALREKKKLPWHRCDIPRKKAMLSSSSTNAKQ